MKIRKMITKLTAIALIGVSSLTIYAEEEKTLPVLDLKQAITSAVNTDGEVTVLEKKIKANDEVVKNTADIASTIYAQAHVYKQKYAQDITYKKDALEYQTVSLYNEIALLREQIAFSEKQIAFKEKKLKESDIKYKKGVLSKLQYEAAETDLEQAKSNKIQQEAQLEEDRVSFNTLAKYDVDYYTLKGDFEIEPYKYVGNVQRYFRESVDTMHENEKRIAEIADDRAIYDTSGPTNEFKADAYYTSKANSASQLNSIEEQKKQQINTLNTTYTTLLNTQQQITDLENTIKQKETELKSLQLKYDKGFASAMSIEEAKIGLEELQLKMLTSKVSVNKMKAAVKKPWVSFY